MTPTFCSVVAAEGDAPAEENEEQEDMDEQDEEKMKSSDEVWRTAAVGGLLLSSAY